MADRRATNKYYPPDWDPSKGSINTYVGQHPLRDRARKLDQGILIVRFEMPYNIWCGGCNKSIGKGVRFNAEKKKIGNYYTTPILSFRMKCHLCSHWFVIHTDPKNSQYVVFEGARKKEEEFEAEDVETVPLADEEERKRLEDDPFYLLEKRGEDERKAKEKIPKLTQLQRLNDAQWADPYTKYQIVRKKFREEKKAADAIASECNSIASKNSLSIPVLPQSAEDARVADGIDFAGGEAESRAKRRRIETVGRGIFLPCRLPDGSSSAGAADSPAAALSSKSLTGVAPMLALAAAKSKIRSDPFLRDAGDVKNWDVKKRRKSSADSTAKTTTTTTTMRSAVSEDVLVLGTRKKKEKKSINCGDTATGSPEVNADSESVGEKATVRFDAGSSNDDAFSEAKGTKVSRPLDSPSASHRSLVSADYDDP